MFAALKSKNMASGQDLSEAEMAMAGMSGGVTVATLITNEVNSIQRITHEVRNDPVGVATTLATDPFSEHMGDAITAQCASMTCCFCSILVVGLLLGPVLYALFTVCQQEKYWSCPDENLPTLLKIMCVADLAVVGLIVIAVSSNLCYASPDRSSRKCMRWTCLPAMCGICVFAIAGVVTFVYFSKIAADEDKCGSELIMSLVWKLLGHSPPPHPPAHMTPPTRARAHARVHTRTKSLVLAGTCSDARFEFPTHRDVFPSLQGSTSVHTF